MHPRASSFHDDDAAATATLHAQTAHGPLVGVDHRWCFKETTTLHIEENPVTRKIKVRHVATKALLLEIRRLDSPFGDLFHVFDSATQKQILTVHGFGFHNTFDVFRGNHEPSGHRAPGLLVVHVARSDTTAYFVDAAARRPCRAVVECGPHDRVALVSVHHAIASEPIARINRPEHIWLKLQYHTLEIAPGVDVLLPLMLWLARWEVFERERLLRDMAQHTGWGIVY